MENSGLGRLPCGTGLSQAEPEVSALTGFDPSRMALLARAQQRLRLAGIGISPPITSPSLVMHHIDGPYLRRLDGTTHWLTWRERFRVWRGKEDAWSLETKLQSREWQPGKMPCVVCDYFPYGSPPHYPTCRNASGIEAQSDETRNAAQPEGREPGPQGDAQALSA